MEGREQMNITRRIFFFCAALFLLLPCVPAFADPPPAWIIGNYKGYNRKYKVDVELRINYDGTVSTRARGDDGKVSTESGYYREGQLVIGSSSYYAERQRDGLRLTQTNDRSNTTEYRRRDIGDRPPNRPLPDRPSRPGSVPSWLIGTFRGYNSKYRVDVELTIERSGDITSLGRQSNGKQTKETGYYSNDQLIIGRNAYYVDRQGDGIRVTEVNDRDNTATYRRDRATDGGPADAPPSWLVGTFSGRNRKYNVDVEIRIDSNGRAVSRGYDSNGKQSTENGAYRDGKLVFGKSYYIDRRGSGFRLTQTDDRSNTADYQRR